MINPRTLLVLGAALVLLLAVAIVFIGRSIRGRMTGALDVRASHRPPKLSRDWAVTPLPTGVARTLTERGLVNAQQLASMSAAEREFFVATVAGRVGQGPKPKLVPGQPGAAPSTEPFTNGESHAVPASAGAAAVAPAAPETVASAGNSTAMLVSGGIHCPVCRAPIAQRAETPLLMSRCPGCSRRIGVRVEGDRLSVTVQYGAPTPAAGVAALRGGSASS
jgi:hypothetical protein